MINKVFCNELNKLVEKIQANYGEKIYYIGRQENLKLHDVSYICENQEDFNWFCEQEYSYFEEIEKENETVRDSIGRTSSFAIKPKYDYSLFRVYDTYEYDKKSTKGKIIMLIEEFFEYEYSIDLSIDCSFDYEIISVNSELAKEFLKGLTIDTREFFNSLYSDMEKNILEEVKAIYKTYEFIESFKQNQVAIYKDFEQEIKDNEEWEKEQEEKQHREYEEQEKKEYQELLFQVIEKLNNSKGDKKFLIQNYLLNNASKKILTDILEEKYQ